MCTLMHHVPCVSNSNTDSSQKVRLVAIPNAADTFYYVTFWYKPLPIGVADNLAGYTRKMENLPTFGAWKVLVLDHGWSNLTHKVF